MQVYDANRVLTVREMRKGDKLHGGMLAGKCVLWEVVTIYPQRALLKVGETIAECSGHDLREMAFYRAENCPLCALQFDVKPSEPRELHVIPRELSASDIPSSFRFRAAQYRGIKKTR